MKPGHFSVLLLLLFSVRSTIVNAQQSNKKTLYDHTLIISANAIWQDTHIYVKKGEQIQISAEGSWSAGKENKKTGPKGMDKFLSEESLSRSLPVGALIGRIGRVIFLVGNEFKGTSPAEGILFLSMNDNPYEFPSHRGNMTVVARSNFQDLEAKDFVTDQIWTIPAAQVISLIQNIGLAGGAVQLSQTDAGRTETIKNSDGTVVQSKSFLSFGPLFSGDGMNDINIDLPVSELSIDQLAGVNSGGTDVGFQYFSFGHLFIVDRVRYKLNDVHCNFDEDMTVSLGQGEILLHINLHSPNPSIVGEGEGYVFVLGIIPVPVGCRMCFGLTPISVTWRSRCI